MPVIALGSVAGGRRRHRTGQLKLLRGTWIASGAVVRVDVAGAREGWWRLGSGSCGQHHNGHTTGSSIVLPAVAGQKPNTIGSMLCSTSLSEPSPEKCRNTRTGRSESAASTRCAHGGCRRRGSREARACRATLPTLARRRPGRSPARFEPGRVSREELRHPLGDAHDILVGWYVADRGRVGVTGTPWRGSGLRQPALCRRSPGQEALQGTVACVTQRVQPCGARATRSALGT
jgi:hypothetical protein